MKRREFIALTVGAAILLAICELATPALAQAGSAGGSIGNRGKSASGGKEPATAPAKKRAPRMESVTAATLRGHWRVDVSCSDGQAVWTFDIRETSATDFVGDYGPGSGKISDGKILGNRVTLVSTHLGSRTWTGTVSQSKGLRMQGSATGFGVTGAFPGNCKFSASKN